MGRNASARRIYERGCRRMTNVLVYDYTAQAIEEAAEKMDTTAAEILDELVSDYLSEIVDD
jgi:6-phosphogluconate dehydrogenase (decarboxylating)